MIVVVTMLLFGVVDSKTRLLPFPRVAQILQGWRVMMMGVKIPFARAAGVAKWRRRRGSVYRAH